jgi:hypothetical protein
MKILIQLLLIISVLSYSNAQNLTQFTNLNITKSWYQQPNGYIYPVAIDIPINPMPDDGYPVCILLHGNGGSGPQIINQFLNLFECHVLIAPTGYLNSWNLCTENSDAPDLEMMNELIDTIQQFNNINPNKIRILGISNGAGLANSLYIENLNPGVDRICAAISHLNEFQYHLGDFYKIGINTNSSISYCGYNQVSNPITSRKYLSISNDNDPTIPYHGGYSPVGIDFLDAEDAIYAIAQNQGFNGVKINWPGVPISNPLIFEYSYLSGNVVHIRGNAQHSLNFSQMDYIKSFFDDSTQSLYLNDKFKKKIKVFPNPTNENINITLREFNGNIQTEVFDIIGNRLKVTNKTNLSLRDYSKGIYLLKVAYGYGVEEIKVIKE